MKTASVVITSMVVLVVLLLQTSTSSADPPCALGTIVPWGPGDLTNTELAMTFSEAEFDQVPKFTHPDQYDPATDKLTLRLFHVFDGGARTGVMGFQLTVDGKTEAVGLQENYANGFDAVGDQNRFHDQTTHDTRLREVLQTQGGTARGLTQVIVVENNDGVLSVKLTIPVLQSVGTQNGSERLIFTGQQQTLCLKSATNLNRR
jgi:hypothetical protein